MADERIIRAIVDKCDFYYGDALTSKEELLRRYLDFFARQFDPEERSVCFTFHTGSRCFDVVSIAALTIGCLAYEYSQNDEILSQLKIGDSVLYKGQRYRWGGVEERCSNGDETRREWVVLYQETKEGHPRKCSYPYETNKHKIKPYYGSSSRTDGRGIRKDTSNREDFISYVLDIPLNETPTSLDYSFVVVANKADFEEICDNLIIKYKDGKSVKVTDVVPVSYYSALDKPIQIGSNVAKSEPVIKVTNNVSVARDIVLDKSQNRVLGLLVTNVESLTSETSELDDLLQRERLKFAHVIAPFSFDSCQRTIDQYESAKIFACTKELLDATTREIVSDNELSRKLHRQTSNVRVRKIEKIEVGGEWRWEIVKRVKSLLMKVKESNFVGDDIDGIILSTMALINLFSSAFFNMKQLENAIANGSINPAVISPKKRLDDLEKDLKSSLLTNQYVEIVSILRKAYESLYEASPKEQALLQFLRDHLNERVAVVVPKAYFVELFNVAYRKEFKNAICVTANAFDPSGEYDIVVETGDFVGKSFDVFQCFTTPRMVLFLYDFESNKFAYRSRKTTRINRNINARNCGLTEDERARAIALVDDCVPETNEQPDREFSVLDDYLKDERAFRKALINKTCDKDSNKTAEVEYVGRFTTDEGILFSKYYSAVVYDEDSEEVIEKKPEKLKPGDKLVFPKSDSVSNIVDQIFDQLERKNKLPPYLLEAKHKSFHWKDVLRRHKDFYNRSYKDLAVSFRKHSCPLSEATIREWLIDESVIIGPQKNEALGVIAQITHDPSLLNNPDGFFDACEIVRSFRGRLRRMIAQAIREKLSRKRTQHDDVFDVVYENVEEYSEILILEDKDKLDKAEACNVRSVNKPIFIGDLL